MRPILLLALLVFATAADVTIKQLVNTGTGDSVVQLSAFTFFQHAEAGFTISAMVSFPHDQNEGNNLPLLSLLQGEGNPFLLTWSPQTTELVLTVNGNKLSGTYELQREQKTLITITQTPQQRLQLWVQDTKVDEVPQVGRLTSAGTLVLHPIVIVHGLWMWDTVSRDTAAVIVAEDHCKVLLVPTGITSIVGVEPVFAYVNGMIHDGLPQDVSTDTRLPLLTAAEWLPETDLEGNTITCSPLNSPECIFCGATSSCLPYTVTSCRSCEGFPNPTWTVQHGVVYKQCVDVATCQLNSVLQPGEECDDGNTINGDGCDDNCRLELHTDLKDNVCLGCPSGYKKVYYGELAYFFQKPEGAPLSCTAVQNGDKLEFSIVTDEVQHVIVDISTSDEPDEHRELWGLITGDPNGDVSQYINPFLLKDKGCFDMFGASLPDGWSTYLNPENPCQRIYKYTINNIFSATLPELWHRSWDAQTNEIQLRAGFRFNNYRAMDPHNFHFKVNETLSWSHYTGVTVRVSTKVAVTSDPLLYYVGMGASTMLEGCFFQGKINIIEPLDTPFVINPDASASTVEFTLNDNIGPHLQFVVTEVDAQRRTVYFQSTTQEENIHGDFVLHLGLLHRDTDMHVQIRLQVALGSTCHTALVNLQLTPGRITVIPTSSNNADNTEETVFGTGDVLEFRIPYASVQTQILLATKDDNITPLLNVSLIHEVTQDVVPVVLNGDWLFPDLPLEQEWVVPPITNECTTDSDCDDADECTIDTCSELRGCFHDITETLECMLTRSCTTDNHCADDEWCKPACALEDTQYCVQYDNRCSNIQQQQQQQQQHSTSCDSLKCQPNGYKCTHFVDTTPVGSCVAAAHSAYQVVLRGKPPVGPGRYRITIELLYALHQPEKANRRRYDDNIVIRRATTSSSVILIVSDVTDPAFQRSCTLSKTVWQSHCGDSLPRDTMCTVPCATDYDGYIQLYCDNDLILHETSDCYPKGQQIGVGLALKLVDVYTDHNCVLQGKINSETPSSSVIDITQSKLHKSGSTVLFTLYSDPSDSPSLIRFKSQTIPTTPISDFTGNYTLVLTLVTPFDQDQSLTTSFEILNMDCDDASGGLVVLYKETVSTQFEVNTNIDIAIKQYIVDNVKSELVLAGINLQFRDNQHQQSIWRIVTNGSQAGRTTLKEGNSRYEVVYTTSLEGIPSGMYTLEAQLPYTRDMAEIKWVNTSVVVNILTTDDLSGSVDEKDQIGKQNAVMLLVVVASVLLVLISICVVCCLVSRRRKGNPVPPPQAWSTKEATGIVPPGQRDEGLRPVCPSTPDSARNPLAPFRMKPNL